MSLQGAGGDHTPHALATLEARADLGQHLAEAFDLELLETAMATVRGRLAPGTWEAFRLTALEGVAAAEAARRLRKKVAVEECDHLQTCE